MDNPVDINSTQIKIKEEELIIKDEVPEDFMADQPDEQNPFTDFPDPLKLDVGDPTNTNEVKLAPSNVEPIDSWDDADTPEVHNRFKSEELSAETPVGRKFQCDICWRCFAHKPSLRRHLIGHKNGKTYSAHKNRPCECLVCGKRFLQNSHLQRHLLLHEGKKLFKCDLCDKSFVQNSDLKGHMFVHTDDKTISCNLCDKTFKKNVYLKKHMSVHTGEKPFRCDACRKCFKTSVYLKRHMVVHEAATPVPCDRCRKQFSNESRLKQHILVHTTKLIKCGICERLFNNEGPFKQHFKFVHSDAKLFPCDTCHKCLETNVGLKKHTVIHEAATPVNTSGVDTGDKEFQCDRCKK